MNRQQISDFIAVKPPYLWLDEVVALTEAKIEAIKFIDPAMPFLAGHYVGFPLFPGALQCEACFQASNVLLTKILPENPDAIPVIARVRDVKFKKMVRPGETLHIEVELLERESRALYLRGRCRVGDVTTTSLNFVATEAPLPTRGAD